MKRYIFFAIVMMAILFAKFNTFATDASTVEIFRGGNLAESDWNPLIAASVNNREITLQIGNKTYTGSKDGLYMNDNLDIMIPVSILRDGINCSARIYDDSELLIRKRELMIQYMLDNTACILNGTEEAILRSPLVKKGEEFFVAIEDIAYLLGYEYTFDMSENKGVGIDEFLDEGYLPYRFDLREEERTSKVEDQGDFGTCWAFATLTALESSLLPERNYEFAQDHMSLCNSFGVSQDAGGDYTMSMAYLAAWQGPVLEADDPYGDEASDASLKPVVHVQEMQVMDSGDITSIKEAVFKYGGVQTSIYTNLKNSDSTSIYYNPDNYSYCYQGAEKPNHDVVIIGWDNSYSKDNFSSPPEQDGAFICQNSWGEEFGENGVFYVSYYDSNIGIHNVVYTRIDELGTYDKVYQSDLCGWVGQMGYEREAIYGANVFTAKGDEEVKAAGFYATGKDTTYDLYVIKDFEDTASLRADNRIKVASGKVSNAGFYTIDFEEGVEVKKGERFAIMIYITTPNAVYPMAVEYVADELTSNVDIKDGEGYISIRGSQWNRVEEKAQSNLCLKAYTKKSENKQEEL